MPYIENTVNVPATAIFKTTSTAQFYLYSFTNSDVFTFNSQNQTYAGLFSTGVYGNGLTYITPDGRYIIGAPYTQWNGPNYLLDTYDSFLNNMVTLTYGSDLNNFVVSNDGRKLYTYSNDSPDIIREYTMPDFNNITNMVPVPTSYGQVMLTGISKDDSTLYLYAAQFLDFSQSLNYLWCINISNPLGQSFSIPVNTTFNPDYLLSYTTEQSNMDTAEQFNMKTAEQSPDGSIIYIQGVTFETSTTISNNALLMIDVTNKTAQTITIPGYINNKLYISPGGQYGYTVMIPEANILLIVPLNNTGKPIIGIPYDSKFNVDNNSVFQILFSQDGSKFYLPVGDRLLIINTNGYN